MAGALPGRGARARARGGDRLRGAGRDPAREGRHRAPGPGHAAPRRRRADAQAPRPAAGAGGSHLRARSDRGGDRAGRGGHAGSVVGPRADPPGRGGSGDRALGGRDRDLSPGDHRHRRIRKGWATAWARIGDIAERALADVGQAVDAYRNALLSTPDDQPALAGLARGLVRQRDWSNAAATLRRLAAVESERDARVGHLVSLGDLLAGPAEDPEGAADAFEGALAVQPSNALAMDRLDAMLTELGEPARLAAALGRFLEVTPDARDRRMRLAALLSGPLGSNGRAVDELRIVVKGNERDVAARAELAARARGGGPAPRGDHRAPRIAAPRGAAGGFAAGAAAPVRTERPAPAGAAVGGRAGGAGPDRSGRGADGAREPRALDARGERHASARRVRQLRPPPERTPPRDGVAGGDVRGAAAPLRPGARRLGR